MRNEQPIEKRTDNRLDLDVFEIFGPTIQGEGPFAGTPAIFVRLAGCNLQCPGCDTIYTGAQRQHLVPGDIIRRVRNLIGRTHTRLVVITGGEPFRQEIGYLIERLVLQNWFVQIETNGTLEPCEYPFSTNIDIRHGAFVVCSPKTPKVHPKFHDIACAFKYVLSFDSVAEDGLPKHVLDQLFGKQVVARPQGRAAHRPIYLQPMDHGPSPIEQADTRRSLAAVKESCMKHGYILGLQIHKLIGVE